MQNMEVMASRDPAVCKAGRGIAQCPVQSSRCCCVPVTMATLAVFLRYHRRKETDTSRQAQTSKETPNWACWFLTENTREGHEVSKTRTQGAIWDLKKKKLNILGKPHTTTGTLTFRDLQSRNQNEYCWPLLIAVWSVSIRKWQIGSTSLTCYLVIIQEKGHGVWVSQRSVWSSGLGGRDGFGTWQGIHLLQPGKESVAEVYPHSYLPFYCG